MIHVPALREKNVHFEKFYSVHTADVLISAACNNEKE